MTNQIPKRYRLAKRPVYEYSNIGGYIYVLQGLYRADGAAGTAGLLRSRYEWRDEEIADLPYAGDSPAYT